MASNTLAKNLEKVSVYVNNFGDVEIPITKIQNREMMLVQASMLREVLNDQLGKIKLGTKEVSVQEIKQLVEAVNLTNEISMKAMGDHKDSKELKSKEESLKRVNDGDDSLVEKGLKDILKDIKNKRGKTKGIEDIDSQITDI